MDCAVNRRTAIRYCEDMMSGNRHEHRQPVCQLTFERMAEPTRLYGGTIGSNYQHQTDTLGKHFILPGNYPRRKPMAKSNLDDGQLDLSRVT